MVVMLRTNLVLILVISNAFLGVQTSLSMPWPFSTKYEVMCPKGGCNVDGSNIFRCENKECAAIPTTLNAGRENRNLLCDDVSHCKVYIFICTNRKYQYSV